MALARLTTIVDASLASLAAKRYEEGLSCVSVHPGWMATKIGGANAPSPPEVAPRPALSSRGGCLLPPCHATPACPSARLLFCSSDHLREPRLSPIPLPLVVPLYMTRDRRAQLAWWAQSWSA